MTELLLPARSKFLPNLELETAVNVAAVACFGILLGQAALRASIPFEINYSEGHVLAAGMRVLQRVSVYPEPASFPYALNPYGPVAYLLTAAGLKLFGIGLFGPRLIVLAAAGMTALLIAWLARRLGGRWTPGILMGALYLAGPLGRVWLPVLRVDYWAALFSLFALLAFVALRRFWFVALIFCWLAVLVKITALAAPLAITVELAIQRRWKGVLTMAAGVGAVFAAFALYPGNSVSYHLFRSHPEPYDVVRAADHFAMAASSSLAPIGLFIFSLSAAFRWTPQNRAAWLYLAACSLTILSTGNPGSDTNHLLEWSAAMSLVAALSLSHLLQRKDPLAQPFLFLLGVLLIFFTWQYSEYKAFIQLVQRDCAEAYAFIRSFPGERILSEDVSALVVGGKPVLVSDVYAMTQQGTSLPWAMGTMEQLAARRYFDLILLGTGMKELGPDFGRWSPALLEVIRKHYRLERKLNCPPCLGAAYVPK